MNYFRYFAYFFHICSALHTLLNRRNSNIPTVELLVINFASSLFTYGSDPRVAAVMVALCLSWYVTQRESGTVLFSAS